MYSGMEVPSDQKRLSDIPGAGMTGNVKTADVSAGN